MTTRRDPLPEWVSRVIGGARRWAPEPGDGDLIWAHLLRQHDLAPEFVRLDTGAIVPVGRDAEGEGA